MISGVVTEDGVPLIVLRLAGDDWVAVIDTGFNGALELPNPLKERLDVISLGLVRSELAAGVVIGEEAFLVQIEFDGDEVETYATFADVEHVLVGTRLLAKHRLEIAFRRESVRLTRSESD